MLVHQRIRASGRFFLPEDKPASQRDVSVEIEQMGSGRTFLHCDCEDMPTLPFLVVFGRAVSFVGHTGEGLPIRTSDLLVHLGQKADRHCFSLSHVVIGDPGATSDSVELALTNLVFESDGKQSQSFTAIVGDSPLSIELVPAKHYDDLVFHLQQTDVRP